MFIERGGFIFKLTRHRVIDINVATRMEVILILKIQLINMQPSDSKQTLQLSPFSQTLQNSTENIMRIVSKASDIPFSAEQTQPSLFDDSFSSIQTPSVCSTCPSINSMSDFGDQSTDDSIAPVSIKQEDNSSRYHPYETSSKANYKRQPKPPYSYVGMILMAIHMSPDKALSLRHIHQSIRNMFPFFRGSYRGWKDSIRHTLSQSPCFFKNSSSHNSKWTFDLTLAPSNALQRQDTPVSRSQYWAPTICQYLKVPELTIPEKMPVPTQHTNFSIDRILAKSPEAADDTRPLHETGSSPTFTKMSLKLKINKPHKQKENPALTKLISDSASKWGVSTYTAMAELQKMCKVMNANSPVQTTETVQIVKTEIPDQCEEVTASTNSTTVPVHTPEPASIFRPYMDLPAHGNQQSTPQTYQHQPSIDQYSRYVSEQYKQYYAEQELAVYTQQYIQQYAYQQQYQFALQQQQQHQYALQQQQMYPYTDQHHFATQPQFPYTSGYSQ